jgi:hypothetical protein
VELVGHRRIDHNLVRIMVAAVGIPEKTTVGKLRFLGEQDGPAEQMLKSRLIELFGLAGEIERAYLVRTRLGNDNQDTVALCLRSGNPDRDKMASEVGSVFSRLFNTKEHLDILFIDDEQELQLRAVCRPFFVIASA